MRPSDLAVVHNKFAENASFLHLSFAEGTKLRLRRDHVCREALFRLLDYVLECSFCFSYFFLLEHEQKNTHTQNVRSGSFSNRIYE